MSRMILISAVLLLLFLMNEYRKKLLQNENKFYRLHVSKRLH